jgi:beta-glucanase (GH16 family)
VWSDDFNSLSYNNNGSIVDNYTWQRPFNGANNAPAIYASGGILHIQWNAGDTTSKPNIIGTRKSVNNLDGSFQYGYFEARMSQPTGNGTTYPQWWLASTYDAWRLDGTDQTARHGGQNPQLNPEFDIVEGGYGSGGWGVPPQEFSATTHKNAGGGSGVPDVAPATFLDATACLDSFHTYGMLWSATSANVTYYVDGVLVATHPKPSSATVPMFLVLGNGGRISGSNLSPVTSDVRVDWVRVWQK